MIHQILWICIYTILAGLGIWLLFWAVEAFFDVKVPPKVKQAVGIVALLIILSYILFAVGVS
jgi:hypothetical protein